VVSFGPNTDDNGMLQLSKRTAPGNEVVLSEKRSDREDYAGIANPFREEWAVDEPQ
jgi:hypothetical protein